MLKEPDRQPESTLLTVVRLLRWDKPAGRLILMIPALWAVFLAADGRPPAALVGVIVLGTLATSAAGCVINDLWDRDIDPRSRKNAIAPPSIPRPHRANWNRSCINFLCLCGNSRFLSQSFKLLAVCRRRTSNYLLSAGKKILSSAAISAINCLGFCSFN